MSENEMVCETQTMDELITQSIQACAMVRSASSIVNKPLHYPFQNFSSLISFFLTFILPQTLLLPNTSQTGTKS